MGKKIKVGLIGIGNCFSGLIQGIEFYAQNPSQSITGIIHEKLRDTEYMILNLYAALM